MVTWGRAMNSELTSEHMNDYPMPFDYEEVVNLTAVVGS